MLIDFQHDADSVIIRLKVLDSSVTTGAGLTGLAHDSAGLIISTIADNEATPTTYTQAASTIETIATLGTYATPTATKCRLKLVDDTNHPGLIEIQLADARFAVASAKSLLVSISGATNCAETDAVIPLRGVNPFDSVRGGMTSLPNAAADAAGGLPTTTKITDARLGALTDWIDGGRLDLLVDAIKTAAERLTAARAAVLTDLIDGGRLDAILDAILVDTGSLNDTALSEISGASDVPAEPTLRQALMLLYMLARNACQATANERRVMNDDGTEVLDAATSDNNNVYDQGKLGGA